jgi:hypothetical protein
LPIDQLGVVSPGPWKEFSMKALRWIPVTALLVLGVATAVSLPACTDQPESVASPEVSSRNLSPLIPQTTYLECMQPCEDAYYSCMRDLAILYDQCINSGHPFDYCEDLFEQYYDMCQASYNACAAGCANAPPSDPGGTSGDPGGTPDPDFKKKGDR